MTAYDNKKKKTLVYAGPLGKTNPARGSIPQSNQMLHPEAYFTKIAESQYILSPNGDRPDCYRHYEALGLGTIPITELDPVLYYHLKGGPVVFGNNDWNMESLLERLHDRAVKKEQMVVNRNLVREDYWMDWVEEEVGIGELNWRILNETLLFDSGEENRTALTNVSVGGETPSRLFFWLEYKSITVFSIFMKKNDTIYVPFSGMQKFVNEVLNDISVNVVIISGQTHKLPKLSENTLATLLNHPRVLFWFCQNLSIFGYPHQKIRPFPYGLKETGHKGKLTFESYKRVYFKHLNNNNTNTNMTAYDNKKKKTLVYAGPLGKTNPARGSIPQSNQMLHPEAYFTKIAESQYILSPNGDRPDCYRHYEALGLGTIPITELDPVLYYHLKEGPVVFGNNDWNMESLLERLHDRAVKKEQMVVNRNLVREDYWMDWVEEEVGIGELNWRILNETLLFDSGEENRTALTNVSVGRRDPL
eukprot:CAMPEP_0196255916 /NCGR_PEP_ID=MMETSP0913-20130531/55570_1 /TAXON_ID=49265 /ORGANISM="Thalassiosira rotula, Strain GSO102" /LENGTH=474 /DNA_ID=CAMNT_0041543403 /DNA_START=690 /DNA_END=2117 /DNA_ORIENTATION=+